MTVQGLVRNRRHLFGRQAAMNTVVPATRAYPFKGVPSVNPNWTDPDIDEGTLDPSAAPYRVAPEITAPLTDPALAYNNLPILHAAFFGGAETPTGAGASKAWSYAPSSTTVDELDPFTYQFGDDVLTDWWQLGDGILESVDITAPEGLGPLSTSMTWRFGSARSTGSTDFAESGTVPTPDLTIDTDPTMVYLKDLKIAIASSTAGLATGQISDALHSFVMRWSGDVDMKRYANGDQSFDIDAYARATRLIELECSWAKTDDIVGEGSESDAWFSETSVLRYVQLTAISKVVAETGTPDIPYSWTMVMPMRYYTRADGESGGNTIVTLVGHAKYDPDDLDGVFTSDIVNTLASADL